MFYFANIYQKFNSNRLTSHYAFKYNVILSEKDLGGTSLPVRLKLIPEQLERNPEVHTENKFLYTYCNKMLGTNAATPSTISS